MRLLIYGGTEHNIRCEIGKWDLPEKGPLLDTYGIPKDGWTIGFGILNDEGYLFLKTEQITGTRIYPFTILFDPDAKIWEKFGWNAAHLAGSLLDENNPLLNDLRSNPESFRTEKLEEMARRLPVFQITPQSNPISQLIAGTLFESEPIAVNPAHLNLLFPGLREIAARIEALPPFLRTGNGWLFGGSSENAKGLGIKLVFDNNLQNFDEPRIRTVIDKGTVSLGSLKSVNQKANATLFEFSKIPAWRWQKTFNQSAEDVLSRVNYLVELSNRESISDEELLLLDKDGNKILAEDVHRVILGLACRTNKDLTPARTGFLLEKFSGGALQPSDLPTEFFDRSTYRMWLVKNRKFPSESELPLKLKAFDCFEICQRIIIEEQNLKNIPKLFAKSITELRAGGAEEYIANLAKTVGDKTSDNLMEVWFDYHKQDFFKKYLAGQFAAKARQTAKKAENNWENTYLRFANDRGGEWLGVNVSLLQVKLFVASLQQSPNSEEVTSWLQALTVSPLRAELSIEEKRNIARLNNTLAESWKNFTSLADLLEEKNLSVERLESPEEAVYLHRELAELFKKNPTVELSKITPPLRKFFGKLPDELADEGTRRGEKSALEKEKPKVEKTAAKKNPPLAFDAKKIAGAKQTIDETSRMIKSALSEEENRAALLEDFRFEQNSPLYSAFPYLPLRTRANILQLLYQNRAADLKKEAARLLKDDQYNPFSLALWECLLLSDIGRKIKTDLNNSWVGKGIDLDKMLNEIIATAVEKEKWGFVKKSDEKPDTEKSSVSSYKNESNKGFFNAYFGWLMFWKK